MKTIKLLMIFLFLCAFSCASLITESNTGAVSAANENEPFPVYSGPKQSVQIVNVAIPAETLSKYPELLDNKVGWGICNRIIETFYDTNRFEFIEEKDAIQQKILENWTMRDSGIAINDEDFEAGNLKAADYLVYAEIYDFSIRQNEKVAGIAAEKEKTTIIGIQLRLVDVETGTFIPASGTGEASSVSSAIWINPQLPFDQSTVGISTDRAVRGAVHTLISRL